MKERSLVIFTILAQMAVGAFLVLGVVAWQISPILSNASTARLVNAVLLFIGLLILLSLLASLFHLGSRRDAWRALTNLRRSWLSREVFFALSFACLGGLLAFFQWFYLGTSGLRFMLALLAGLCGLALIYCMARVYMLRTVAVWNSWLTLASFALTTLLLGGLAVGAALAVMSLCLPWEQAFAVLAGLRGIGALLLLALLVQLVLIPLQVARLAFDDSPRPRRRPLSQVYLLRVAPLFFGVALAGVLFFSSAPLDAPGALGTLLALGLVLIAELYSRSVFYASYFPPM